MSMATLSACWDWKVEPVSRDFASTEQNLDLWNPEDDVIFVSSQDVKDERSQTQSPKLLDDMESLDEWIKEEPFAMWLEEKIDLSNFGDLDTPSPLPNEYSQSFSNVQTSEDVSKKSPTTNLKNGILTPHYEGPDEAQKFFQEFDNVFEFVEHNHGTLTPPRSPPQLSFLGLENVYVQEDCSTHLTPPRSPLESSFSEIQKEYSQNDSNNQFIFTPMQQMMPDSTYKPPEISNISSPIAYDDKKISLLPSLEQIVPSTPAPDIVQELAAVEELIRTRVEALETSSFISEEPTVSWDKAIPASAESSPVHISDSTSQVQNVIPLSPSTASNASVDSAEDMTDDPDWIPTTVQTVSSFRKTSKERKRVKPYGSGTEEKRLRKKEQNKNAATRYRQKKKAEVEEILNEEKQLAEKKEKLETQVTDIAREIKYLKGLMRDVFRAKGLLK